MKRHEIENLAQRFDISDDEADRICAVVGTEEEFVNVWETTDWWTDENNPSD
jgi:plasmid maintenance system antidote protein VapI